MQLNKRQVDISFLIAGLILISGYIFLVQRPLNAKLRGLRSERKSLKENTVSIETIKQRLDQLAQEQAPLYQEIQSLKTDFSQTDSLWNIMQHMGSTAEKLGLKVVLMHPKTEEETDHYIHNSLFIKLEGTFLALYRFVYLMEKDNPTLQVTSIKLDTQSKNSSHISGQIHLDLFTPNTLTVSGAFTSHDPER